MTKKMKKKKIIDVKTEDVTYLLSTSYLLRTGGFVHFGDYQVVNNEYKGRTLHTKESLFYSELALERPSIISHCLS